MSQTAELADHLDTRMSAIIALWRATVERKGDVPNAERLSPSEFVDHVPEILDRIGERLRGESGDPTVEAKEHGRLRWVQGYDVAEVVAELGHLRSALSRATFGQAREGLLDTNGLEVACSAIDSVLDEVIAESVSRHQQENQAREDQAQSDLERRQESAELERLKLKTVLERLPVGVWVVGSDGLILAINREAERIQGFSAKDIVGRLRLHDSDSVYHLKTLDGRLLNADEFPLSRALLGEVIRREDLLWEVDEVGTRRIIASASPLCDSRGGITGAVAVAQDVTEQRRLEVDLARRDEQFRLIVATSPAMIWRADAEGRCDFFNQTWLEFRGRGLTLELELGWTDGVHPDDVLPMLRARRESFGRREAFEQTYRMLRRDGRYRWVVDRASPWLDPDGTCLGYFGACLDITERVELETTLEQQSTHKSRLLTTLSHDARTPLHAVSLATELLESQLQDFNKAEFQENLRTIRHSVRNVMDLLSDLLDLTRIDAGVSLAETTRFALDEAINECFSSVEHVAKAKGLELTKELDGLTDLVVETDRAKLKQIVANLLSNAVRYTEKGSVRIHCARPPGRILIAVEDTGVGIAREDQSKIFDEFAMLSNPSRREGEGTGLGLAICRRLATLLRGEITLASVKGVGTTFTLSLPDEIAADGSTVEPPAVETVRRSGTILIAEDHEASRRTLSRVIGKLGYRTLEAGTGLEVLELLEKERPMVVLMDVNMPEMDGIDATRAIRADARFRDLPIFALTGDVTAVNQQKIGQAGVDGYLEKPVSWDQIERALAKVRDRL